MLRKSLFQQLYPSYLLITFLSLGAIGWYMVATFKDFHFQRTISDLESRAHLVKQKILPDFREDPGKDFQETCRELGKSGAFRLTIILKSGRVVCDSHEDPLRMDNHSDRPEVRQALSAPLGYSRRSSSTLQTQLMYVAIPIVKNHSVVGVVRTAIPLTILEETLEGMVWKIILAGGVIGLIGTLISLFLSRRISKPLSVMKENAVRFAGGNLESQIKVQGPDDVVSLAQALNQMAAQLDDRIRTITRQRNEHEAILSSMEEGVFAVDSREKVISINQAAARLFGIPPERAHGRTVPEIVRNAQLQEFVKRVLDSGMFQEEDITFFQNEKERALQAVGTVLHDSQNIHAGAVVVLNDVTRLRRLETMRRDFVANVSHELKTPITSIKGFVETLLMGAMENPEDTKRFLEIIAKQSDRLNAIIEDLLSLSRIEQEAEKQGIVKQPSILFNVLESAVQACQTKAQNKNIKVSLNCDPQLKIPIKPALIEQAVVNLVDNAIKYSENEKTIQVAVRTSRHFAVVEVADQGPGIPEEHLSRLFERFYRVDKARSRNLGGTGLGLAIVKHISQVHGGDVSVQSTVGEGSVFKIHLPLNTLK